MSASRRRTLSSALAVLIGLGASGLAACGDGGQDDQGRLSRATASRLRTTLDEIKQTAASRDCTRAAEQAAVLGQQVSSLPANVDADLRDALASGANRLQSLVDEQCTPATPTTTETPPTETDSEQQAKDEQEAKKQAQKKAKEQEKQAKQEEKKTKEESKPQDQQQGDEQQGNEQSGGDGSAGQGTGGVTP